MSLVSTTSARPILAGLLLPVILVACTAGPDYRPPEPPAPARLTAEPLPGQTASAEGPGGGAQRFVGGQEVPAAWWRLFGSPRLDRLVERAMAANPSLDRAQAALRQARATLQADRAALWPSLTGSLSRQDSSSLGRKSTAAAESDYTLYGASLGLSYSPDLFGGQRRTIEGAEASVEDSRFALEASRLSLTANLVTAALNEASLSARIAATEEVVAHEASQLELMRTRTEAGAESLANLLAQETTLRTTEAGLPGLRAQREQQRHRLAIYLGQAPGDYAEPGLSLDELHLPEELPLSLPARLVERRPDIRQAEAQLHQASAAIGVAAANRLPAFSIDASLSGNASRLADLLSSGLVGLTLSASQTLFDGGALSARQAAAVAAHDQALASYRSTVLAGLQDVADCLKALQYDADALAARAAGEALARRSLEVATVQYRAGHIAYSSLLTAERDSLSASIERISAQAQRYADTAALFQASGGGW